MHTIAILLVLKATFISVDRAILWPCFKLKVTPKGLIPLL